MRKNFLENYGAKNAGTQKIEGGGLKKVDGFDKEPGPGRRLAFWVASTWVGIIPLALGRSRVKAPPSLNSPLTARRARDQPPISRSRQGQIEHVPCLPPPLRGVTATGSGLGRREAGLLAE